MSSAINHEVHQGSMSHKRTSGYKSLLLQRILSKLEHFSPSFRLLRIHFSRKCNLRMGPLQSHTSNCRNLSIKAEHLRSKSTTQNKASRQKIQSNTCHSWPDHPGSSPQVVLQLVRDDVRGSTRGTTVHAWWQIWKPSTIAKGGFNVQRQRGDPSQYVGFSFISFIDWSVIIFSARRGWCWNLKRWSAEGLAIG